MRAISCDLSSELDVLEIHTFADLHIGDPNADIKDVKERLNQVKETPNAYIILNGDIINNATKTSVSDCYAEKIPPMEQIQMCLDLFEPVKDKILAVTSGNHENRTYIKEGIDIMGIVTEQMGIGDKYSKEGAFIFVKFGEPRCKNFSSNHVRGGQLGQRKMLYTLYVTHGSGGGRKEGAKAIRLADMASVVDADVYIHSHTHLPMIMKQAFFRPDRAHFKVQSYDKLFVNTSASLDFGGYSQLFEMKPNSKACPVIYLNGHRREMTAKL